MGTEGDLHTPHWHGNDVTVNGMRMDVVDDLEIAVAEYVDWFNHRRPARRDRPRSAR